MLLKERFLRELMDDGRWLIVTASRTLNPQLSTLNQRRPCAFNAFPYLSNDLERSGHSSFIIHNSSLSFYTLQLSRCYVQRRRPISGAAVLDCRGYSTASSHGESSPSHSFFGRLQPIDSARNRLTQNRGPW